MKYLIIYVVGLFFILSSSVSCKNNDIDIKKHKEEIEAFRKQKDEDYKIPKKTMLTPDLLADFKGLKYYPIDYKYQVNAILTRLAELPEIEIKTSTGKVSDYVIYGKLSFKINGKTHELSAYQSARLDADKRKAGDLFVPFTDATSGNQTYGGGRYLVLDNPEGSDLVIDFNLAYNPYCVYNASHSCPIPPKENDLSVKIPVGELMY